MFAAWKEIAVLILVFKVAKRESFKFDGVLTLTISLFLSLIFVYYLLANSLTDGLAVLRDHLFPILLFVSLSVCTLNRVVVRNAITLFYLSAFLGLLAGFLQHFLYNIQISSIKGVIDFIDSAGYIKYKTDSFRIMGIERMSGLFSGPNDFGLYCSLVITITIGVLSSQIKLIFKKWFIRFIYLNLILAIFCILFAFSRAGWAVSLFSLVVLFKFNKMKINPTLIAGGLFLLISVTLLTFTINPSVGDIVVKSFTGKEESAADRGNSFFKGLDRNLDEPLGHGLATADNRSKDYEFFVESAFMNITYEIGFIGLSLLVFLHLLILRRIVKRRYLNSNPFSGIAVAFSIASLIVCFLSVNPYGMPYIYFWWLILALGINRSLVSPENFLPFKKQYVVSMHIPESAALY